MKKKEKTILIMILKMKICQHQLHINVLFVVNIILKMSIHMIYVLFVAGKMMIILTGTETIVYSVLVNTYPRNTMIKGMTHLLQIRSEARPNAHSGNNNSSHC